MSKRKQKSLDEIYYGVEPHAEDDRDKSKCMNWYNYMSDNKSCGEWLSTWMSEREYDSQYVKGVKRLKYVPRTAAALARMQTRAVPCVFKDNLLDPSTTSFIEKHVEKCIEDIKSSKAIQQEERKKKPVISIQERIQNKADEYAGEIEYQLDCYIDDPKNKFDVFAYLTDEKVSAPVAVKVGDNFFNLERELEEAVAGTCPQLKEAYSFLSKKGLKDYYKYVCDIRIDCDKYATGQRGQKRTRRKKVYTATEQTKKLNYKITDTEYHLTSVNPELIVGAMQLWTFNTKTKELTKFVAEDRMGLGVKGTTIQKFNNYSAMKKIGNKTKHFLDRIESGGKIVLSKVLDEINTKSSKPTGRINEHTILLRTE